MVTTQGPTGGQERLPLQLPGPSPGDELQFIDAMSADLDYDEVDDDDIDLLNSDNGESATNMVAVDNDYLQGLINDEHDEEMIGGCGGGVDNSDSRAGSVEPPFDNMEYSITDGKECTMSEQLDRHYQLQHQQQQYQQHQQLQRQQNRHLRHPNSAPPSASLVSLEDASVDRLPQFRSAPRAIAKTSRKDNDLTSNANITGMLSQAGSTGSSGSNFMNNLLGHGHGGTFHNTHMSHTPPTHMATSYEARHFGKRSRSGSISERLRVSSELEEKGLIDREQKAVIKDLIISGDHDLQSALDKYEDGDPTMLESIIQCGSLTKRATSDIDLLGDLDLDFLTVHDGQHQEQAMPQADFISSVSADPVTSSSLMYSAPNQTTSMSRSDTSVPSDGIGDLDFEGAFENGLVFGQAQDRAHSPLSSLGPVPQDTATRSRSNSTFSIDFDPRARSNSMFSVDFDPRARSNSLFSALIESNGREGATEYGRWMEGSSVLPTIAESGIRISKPARRTSAPVLSNLSLSLAAHEESVPDFVGSSTSLGVSNPILLSDNEKEDADVESKKRDKKEKKMQRDKEKQLRKEKREQKKAEEERPAHVTGSGLPRSLSDSNLRTRTDEDGLVEVERPEGWVGAYSPESRKARIQRFSSKRSHRVWTKTVKYDVRKNFANSRLRVKGRFVKKEDETLMRELMSLT